MLTKKKLRDSIDEHVEATLDAVGELARRVRTANARVDHWASVHMELQNSLDELKEHLATNGVIRDLRSLERRTADLERRIAELNTNGVATAINKLNAEVFETKKEKEAAGYSGAIIYRMLGLGKDYQPEQEATLAGKVDAIAEHLGLDLTVTPEKTTEAKVVAKKVTKKKGKK